MPDNLIFSQLKHILRLPSSAYWKPTFRPKNRNTLPGDPANERDHSRPITHPSLFTTHTQMPLDTSTYDLALLRVDGRRWNELRRLHGQIRTQAAADGSSYLEMGNTKVMCVISGPSEDGGRRRGQMAASASTASGGSTAADIVVSIVVGGFSSVDRKKRGRGDK